MKVGIRWCITLAALALLAGCGKGEAEAPPYTILDSGVPASTNDRLYWLDNDRVIFVSYGPKPKSLEEAGKHPRVPSINIWDTRTNKVEFYAKGSHLCYSDGHIKYMPAETVPDDPANPVKVYWREGPLDGPELKVLRYKTEEEYREWYRAHVDNPHTCRWVERPGYAKGRRAMPLREGDGWLVHSKPWNVNEPGEWLLYRLDGSVIKTGIPHMVLRNQWLDYAEAYLFRSTSGGDQIPKTDCIRYWWLKSGGAIDSGCEDIRAVKKIDPKSGVALYPTRPGMLFFAGNNEDYSVGSAGFYQLFNGGARRIVAGGMEQSALSPDGCKLAYTHIPFFQARGVGEPGEIVLKSINLCQTGKGDQS